MLRSRRWAGRVAGAVVACAVAAALAGGCGGGGSAEAVRAAAPEVAFAPVVHLHPRERFMPVGVRWFLDRSRLWISYGAACGNGKIAVGRTLEEEQSEVVQWIYVQRMGWGSAYWRQVYADLECDRKREAERYYANQLTRPRHDSPQRAPALHLDEGYYLDLVDSARGGRPPERRGGQAVVQARVWYQRRPVELDGGEGIRLRYWLLYGMSEPADGEGNRLPEAAHEGDWERVEVVLRAGEGDGEWEPVALRLGDDEGGGWRELDWEQVRRERGAGAAGATRPVLYAARGSHTLYARPGRHRRGVDVADHEPVEVVDVAAGPCATCPRWQTSERLLEARQRWWYTFGGAWGQPGPTSLTTGPLGPHGKWAAPDPAAQIRRLENRP